MIGSRAAPPRSTAVMTVDGALVVPGVRAAPRVRCWRRTRPSPPCRSRTSASPTDLQRAAVGDVQHGRWRTLPVGLYARTNNGAGVLQNTPIAGVVATEPHDYRIEWDTGRGSVLRRRRTRRDAGRGVHGGAQRRRERPRLRRHPADGGLAPARSVLEHGHVHVARPGNQRSADDLGHADGRARRSGDHLRDAYDQQPQRPLVGLAAPRRERRDPEPARPLHPVPGDLHGHRPDRLAAPLWRDHLLRHR